MLQLLNSAGNILQQFLFAQSPEYGVQPWYYCCTMGGGLGSSKYKKFSDLNKNVCVLWEQVLGFSTWGIGLNVHGKKVLGLHTWEIGLWFAYLWWKRFKVCVPEE